MFSAPLGMKYEKVSVHGNLLVRDEPIASYVQKAIEGFASGRFETQGEVKRYLESCPAFPKDHPDGTIRFEVVARIMRRIHYAGYLERPESDVDLRKGHHQGLVSLETWQTAQDHIDGAKRAPVRKDINADFPLRGFVLCNDCNNPLTANWSKSKTGKKHPFYLCFTKSCESYRKSIRHDVLEEAFTGYLCAIEPSETLIALTKAMFRNIWDQRAEQAQAGMISLKRQVTKIEKQIDGLLDRIVDASMPSVVSAYEKRLARLEQDKLIGQEKLGKTAESTHSFEQLFEFACAFLASPWKLWKSGQLTLQRTVLKLAFAERITYCRKTGLRTPETTLPFKVLGRCASHKRGSGGPRRIRTPDPLIRSQVLYPAELSVH